MFGQNFNFNYLSFDKIISYLAYPPYPSYFLVLKILFICISFYFIISIIYSMKYSHYIQWLWGDSRESLEEFLTKRPYGVRKIEAEWGKIKKRLETASESDHKLAIIEADGILDSVLKNIGYKGDSLGDRLKLINVEIIPSLDKVWEAYNVRNCIVRDPDYKITLEKSKRTLDIYEKALNELDVF